MGISRADVLAQNKPKNEFVRKDLEVSDWTTPRGLVCAMTSQHTGQSEGLGGTRPSCGRGGEAAPAVGLSGAQSIQVNRAIS